MADNWYYVQKGNRQGPVAVEVIETLISNQELKVEDFVWKKGFENWKKIKDVGELQVREAAKTAPAPVQDIPPELSKLEFKEVRLKDLNPDERVVFIRIGNDRGVATSDYGPFSVNNLKQLFKENRINGKTSLFTKGMKEWKFLGDLPEYQDVFEEVPPVIKDTDRRAAARKPFIARLFVQNNKKVFEGICRDISIGGMQVLVDDFKGNSGDKVSINVHPENTEFHFTASGVVVRILEGNSGFSFRFNHLADEAKRSIEKYLQES